MRVSNNQLLGSSLLAMQKQAGEALKYQQQIASGNRFSKASEGAVELAQGVVLQFEKSRYEMLKANQNVVALRASIAYTTLDTMASLLFNLKEIASRATFPGLDESSLNALHAEAQVAYDAFVDLAESENASGEPYFFDDEPPGVPDLEIEPGVFVAPGIGEREALGATLVNPSEEVFGDLFPEDPDPILFTGYAESNYVDFREYIAKVKLFVDSLGAMETPGTPAGTTALDSAIDQILLMRTRAGTIAAQVDIARSSLDSKTIEIDAARARYLETDIAEASTKLVRAQTLLEAARSIFARLEASNLFQRLL